MVLNRNACKYFRTSTNCSVVVTASTSNDRWGDGQGVVGVVAEVNVDNGNDESGSGFEADVKPKVREIGESSKPPVRFNKKKRDAEHLQMQMISMLGQEDDEIDLVFHAMSKKNQEKSDR